MGKAIPLLVELGEIVLYPSKDGCMGEIDAMPSHHVLGDHDS
jgi:hypothetical protein